jgi:Uma2 family endonuclease
MTVAAPTVHLTADEFYQLGDEARGYELIDGRLEEVNVAAKSSRVGNRISRRLDEYADRCGGGWAFPQDTGFRCFDGRTVRKPDAAFIAGDRYTQEQYESEGFITVCPDVVAEVISPRDVAYEVTAKRRQWLAAGVKVVWVVDPGDQTVYAYHADGSVRVFLSADTLTGEPVLPGFAVPVADLFKLPGG